MKNYGDRGGCYPSYDTKAEFNNCFIIHSKYPIPSLKTWLKHAYLDRSIDMKFIFDSARLGCSGPQIVSKQQMSPFELSSRCYHG